jgi:hypothetical protein
MLTQHTIDCLEYEASRQPFLWREFDVPGAQNGKARCGAGEFGLTPIVVPGTFLE